MIAEWIQQEIWPPLPTWRDRRLVVGFGYELVERMLHVIPTSSGYFDGLRDAVHAFVAGAFIDDQIELPPPVLNDDISVMLRSVGMLMRSYNASITSTCVPAERLWLPRAYSAGVPADVCNEALLRWRFLDATERKPAHRSLYEAFVAIWYVDSFREAYKLVDEELAHVHTEACTKRLRSYDAGSR